MAEVIRYVDTDIVGGDADGTSWANAYSSLTIWEAAEQTDLPTDGDWHHVFVRASSRSTSGVVPSRLLARIPLSLNFFSIFLAVATSEANRIACLPLANFL